MKKTILLSGLVLSAWSLMAQTHHFNSFGKTTNNKHSKFINGLMAHQTTQGSGTTQQKPTGIQQRVIAQSFTSDDETGDSTRYIFSGTRTSEYNHNNEELNYNTAFDSDYLPNGISPFANISLDIQADSIKGYYVPGLPNYIYKGFYNADSKLDSFYSMYSMGPNYNTSKVLHIFNSNGYLIQATELDENIGGTSFDSVYVHRYFYSSTGDRLVSDTMYDYTAGGNLFPFSYTTYNYNASNKLDTIKEFEYNGANDFMTSKIYLAYEAGAIGRVNRANTYYYDETDPNGNYGYDDTFGYTDNSMLYTFHEQYYLDETGSVLDGNRMIKTLGANNFPDTLKGYYAETPGNWVATGIGKYHYNSYDNPDSLVTYMEEDGEMIKMKRSFYYETFDDNTTPPPTSIKDIKANANFSIYPNPFDNKINIDWKTAGTKATISLINMVGQKVYTLNTSLSTGSNTIDLPATAIGNYILLIQDEKGNTFNQKITKK